MPYLIIAGKVTQNNVPTPMYILARLNLDSQCISVAKEYADLQDRGRHQRRSRQRWTKKKASGKSVKAANTFPGGTHDLWIRYWLAAGGIDPDKDIETITVPPPQMVANMKVGTMDCFCVVRAVEPAARPPGHRLHRDHHRRALEQASREVARHARRLGRQASEGRARRSLMAVMEAQQWCDKPENHEELATIMAKRQWINAPVADIIERTKGKFDYGIPGKVVENSPHIMKYWSDFASYPFQSHDLWFITEDIRWGKFEPDVDAKALIEQGQPRGHLARGGEGAVGVPAAADSGLDLARQGDLLRRQGLRSGEPARLSQEPGDQARRDRMIARGRPCAGGRHSHRLLQTETSSMNMPLVKTEPVTATPIAAGDARRCCRCAPKRPPLSTTDRDARAGNLAARRGAADRRHRAHAC